MTYIACRLLLPPFSFLAIFLFVFSSSLVYYSHELKQYTGDVFASLVLGSIGLTYLNKPSRTRLYLCSATFVILAFFSYPALLWAPGLLFAMLVTMKREKSSLNRPHLEGPRWPDAVAFGLCTFGVAIVDYFVFIRPNIQPMLEAFFGSGFFHGNNAWAFLKFYVNKFLGLASLLFPKPYSTQQLIQILTACSACWRYQTILVPQRPRQRKSNPASVLIAANPCGFFRKPSRPLPFTCC